MATYSFTAADHVTATVPSPGPLVEGVPTVLWTSMEYDTTAEGANYSSLEATVEYHAFTPDTTDTANQPFNFEVVMVCHVKQDGEWAEIGRQNTPIRKVTQGRKRKIVIAPNMILEEEGIDQWIFGLGPEPALLKSRFGESAEGNVRFCLLGIDYDPSGPNPLVSCEFSLRGKRYGIT